ncbi:glycosyltransferase family 2 protein [Actinacidiphila sp. bgisy160]|uniref:glycosyltransferase family 2 protein n=1 Tax=Actinacidiphila sp. bgisy160 TaxID=3413796 RepID=UPI003D74329F
MNTPSISVVIGVYEAMPYLVRCLESVETQTLGAEHIEIIAVDDGSSDGSGAYLDEFAARSAIPTRVVHQANSGGPSGPRNTGLDLARGRFVFFLDADDYLGEETFERMLAVAERNGTDVVLGRVEGVNRSAPKSMWGRNHERTDVFSSQIRFTLSAQKLFRRELLVRHGMRFREDLKTGEDAHFTMDAYLRANGVSVVADYTCYYLVGREDGKHVTKSGTYVLRFDSARALTELIAERVPPGDKRDLLMTRPFTVTLLPQFGPRFLAGSEEEQRHKVELGRPLVQEYFTDGVARRLRVHERLRLHCVGQGRLDLLADAVGFVRSKAEAPVHLDAGGTRAYLALPHFRDEAAGIPDHVYEMTRDPIPDDIAARIKSAGVKANPARRPTRAGRLLRRVLGRALAGKVARLAARTGLRQVRAGR